MDRRSFLQLGSTIGLALGFGARNITNRVLERVDDSTIAELKLGETITQLPDVVEDVVKPAVLAPLPSRQYDCYPVNSLATFDYSRMLEHYLDPSCRITNVGYTDYAQVYVPQATIRDPSEEIRETLVKSIKLEHCYVSFIISDTFVTGYADVMQMFFEPSLASLAKMITQKEVYVGRLPVNTHPGFACCESNGGRVPIRTTMYYDARRMGTRVVMEFKATLDEATLAA